MRRYLGVVVPVLTALLLTSAPAAAQQGVAEHTNPVTDGYSIDFPDPAVMRGKDGAWYAYSTGGPFDEQDERNATSKIARSDDLVHWEEVGPFFAEGNEPGYAAEGTGYWAPDVRYLNGQYLLYYTVPDTTTSAKTFDPAIGVATAPTPEGPWEPADEPLVPPRPVGDGFDTVIDPALFTDSDGTQYLYYGGYGSGLYVAELSADGMRVTSEPELVAASRYEGPYVVHRDGWYYLFASSANCCAGPTTGYAVFAGRSKSPRGPFVDRLGVSMAESRAGGTPVLAANGNRWIGTGHHSGVVDVSGQDWMTYHAIDRDDPWLDVVPGFTMRPMNVDRLDWVRGWPTVRAGRYASDTPQPAPLTRGEVDDRFTDADQTGRTFTTVSGELAVEGPDPQSGGYGALADGTVATTRKLGRADVRVEADVRSAGASSTGVLARARGAGTGVRATVDSERRALRVDALVRGRVVGSASTPLPEGYDATAWHSLALEVRGGTATADVTDSRMDDPWASTRLRLPAALRVPGAAGVTSDGAGEVDNFSANRLYRPVDRTVPDPQPGVPVPELSDEFDGDLGAGWSWLREDDAAHVADGSLVWPTQESDIVGDGTPGALLRDAPDGTYTVETKLSIDLGVDTVRNFQQAGLLVYAGDDEFLRLDVVAVGNTRITEFGKETVFQDRRSWGGSLVGAPGETTWLRLRHTTDPETGEHRYRAASSTDGEHWTWGMTWTMPADADPRIGLVSQGSLPETTAELGKATARFDYVRMSR